ncbi:hypothetical protein [Hymenobacter jejuensis]|uniref:Uncharacterized protein n=1 Tax=Hymenobacter jejuensis TaxID=2502781 RepID=A0A5B8A6G0_9BACT|nr:hypothetical protein [Hymenobacter jejuensis]QDA61922.1 hypothetical protein FHG12_18270 [Hymenobacter jejuensis]
MKKSVLIALLSTALSLPGFSQARYDTAAPAATNVYHKALTEFCTYVQQYFPTVKEIWLEENLLLRLPASTTINGLTLVCVSPEALQQKLKHRPKRVYLTRVVPLQVEGNEFVIKVIPFAVQKTGRQLQLINSGALSTYFQYDCGVHKFVFMGSKGGFSTLQ